MRHIVSLDDVDVVIDGTTVLHGISFRITGDQHWGIVGSNGCGKSTFLALLAGQRWPAPGRGARAYDFGFGPERDAITARERITLLGHELQDLYFARQWNFRARDIVLSGFTRSDIPRRNPSPEICERADRLLADLDLANLADRRFLTLSRGEQRRVLIGRALAFGPDILLLDEPASGLDPGARSALETTLRRVARRTRLVVATHLDSELPDAVTHVARIENGRMQIIEDPTGRAAAASGPAAGVTGKVADTGCDRSAEADAARPVIIALENASVWLDGHRILDGLDWEIRAGENWLIAGANGAGKSTLLRLLHAELRPERGGSIRWPAFGNTRDVWQLRQSIALVSPELQARYRYPTTVFDAVASGFHSSIGLVRRLSAPQCRRVTELLHAFELDGLADRMIRSLSYGQRHRTLIARTLAADPKLLLLDEPWEGLDKATSAIVAREISDAMARGTQVICVSHVGPRGLELNRRLLLDHGRIVSADDTGARPENSASVLPPERDSRPR